jgi:Holliday junction resolvase RusA-like endonuclease
MPEWTFKISPIAASRPRISRCRAYFTGPYKVFRLAMIDIVPETIGECFIPYERSLRVDVEIYVKRPKKTKLSAPRADIDNYLKAIFDSLNGKLWEDDKQIISVYATKQWAQPGEEGYFTLGLEEENDRD